jgi:outer membrane receptor protein involved in Fe transport
MKSKILFLLLLAIALSFAQKTTNTNFKSGLIKGIIYDSLSNLPIEYANIALINTRTQKISGGSITDKDGNFTISELSPGRYILEIKFIGYQKKRITDLLITPQKTTIDLGIIKLLTADKQLQEVVVTGKKEMMEFKLDKRVFNLDETTQNSGGSAADVLQNVPSVSVDIDGNISLRGNQNVTILIDNRPVSLMGMSNADAMAQLPASSIERIEIVTNPSAKYDPDGTTGIINIITKKDNTQNYSALINLNAGNNDRYNGSLNLNYRYNTWNFFGSYNFRIMNMEFKNTSERTNFYPDTSYYNQYGSSKREMNMHNFMFGTEYNFSNDHSLLFTFSYNLNNRKMNGNINYLSLSENLATIEDYYRISKNTEDNHGFNFNINHKININDKGQNLITNLSYSKFLEDENSNINLQGNYKPKNFNGFTQQNSKRNNLTLQSDYTLPFDEFTQLETGVKLSNNWRSDDNSFTSKNNLRFNNYDFDENFYSFYTTFGSRYDNLKFQFGLRYEYAKINLNQKSQNLKVDKIYKSIFPTLHISYDITTTNLLQFSYSRRLNRPNANQLNPFIDSTDYPYINTGNPNISPEYYNSYEFIHSIILGPTSINTSLFYRNTNDNVENLKYYYADGTIISKPVNLSKQESYGFEIVSQNNFANFIRANISFSYYKFNIKGGYTDNLGNYQNLNTSSYNWDTKLNTTITFQKGFDLMFNITYNSPSVTAQGQTKAFIHNDLSLRKNIIEDKLFLTFRTFDPFKLMKFENTTNTQYYTSFSKRERNSNAFFIGITYKFNDFKQTRTKTNEEQRDDLMQ